MTLRRVRVVGCGNRDAGDDGIGLLLAEQLRTRVPPSVEVRIVAAGGVGLLDCGDDVDTLIIVDAARATDDLPVGQWRRFRFPADRGQLQTLPLAGTHVLGIVQALELARTLDRLPRTVLLYAVAGSQFGTGAAMSSAVQRSLAAVTGELQLEIQRSLATSGDPAQEVKADCG